jgi:signal recognition particle receptor subunit beta
MTMPHISYASREIAFKLVYFGPGLSGKTTNLERLHAALCPEVRGNMISLDTTDDRTLFFDFLPVELGRVNGYGIRFNVYTVPGQIYYEASRRLIVDGADGIVFVADSSRQRLDDNIVSYGLMMDNIRQCRPDPESFPIVLQYNKRDLDDPLPLGTLEASLDLTGIPVEEAVAAQGKGVMETVRTLSRLVVGKLEL